MSNRSTDVYVCRRELMLCPADVLGTDIASKKRSGKICSFCCASLPAPYTWGEKYCPHCPPAKAHRLCMSFAYRSGEWHCGFRDAGSESLLLARLALRDVGRLYLAAERGRGILDKETKQAFYRAVDAGRGDV